MSDTPRTDATCDLQFGDWEEKAGQLQREMVKLERELSDALDQLDTATEVNVRLHAEVKRLTDALDAASSTGQLVFAMEQRSEHAEAEVARLREALENIANGVNPFGTTIESQLTTLIARSALAAGGKP